MQLGLVGLGKMGVNMRAAPARAAVTRSSATTRSPEVSDVPTLAALVGRSPHRARCG